MKDNRHSGKLQTFEDTRWGYTATLRIDQTAERPFVLRIRDAYGSIRHTFEAETARAAKLYLERQFLAPNRYSDEMRRGNWYTVKGYVCDIE